MYDPNGLWYPMVRQDADLCTAEDDSEHLQVIWKSQLDINRRIGIIASLENAIAAAAEMVDDEESEEMECLDEDGEDTVLQYEPSNTSSFTESMVSLLDASHDALQQMIVDFNNRFSNDNEFPIEWGSKLREHVKKYGTFVKPATSYVLGGPHLWAVGRNTAENVSEYVLVPMTSYKVKYSSKSWYYDPYPEEPETDNDDDEVIMDQ